MRNDVATWQRAAETTSRRCCTTSRRSGSILDGFLAHFEPIIGGFLSKKTLGIGEGGFGTIFWAFLRENKLPLGGNTLGLVLGEISRVRSWKRKNT